MNESGKVSCINEMEADVSFHLNVVIITEQSLSIDR